MIGLGLSLPQVAARGGSVAGPVLRLNGIQPSYSLTKSSTNAAALSLNGIANTYRVRN